MFSFKKDILDRVSTPPNKTSYYWRDCFSLLSFLILHIIYLARLFSLLQWVKFIVRTIRKYSIDKESVRINVPSLVVELYYLITAGFFVLITLLGHDGGYGPIIRFVAYYFFAESVLWVLYYFFFRRFFEEKYAIMHSLEYIVVFPLVIIIQSCCMSVICGYGLIEGISMLINPSESSPLPILILSVVYTAVILGLIINNLPVENTKEKGNYRHHILIVGYGAVVKDRLLGAISERVCEIKEYTNIVIYDRQKPDIKTPFESKMQKKQSNLSIASYALPDNTKEPAEYYKELDLFRKRILASQILWIATPPHAHLKYVESMYYSNQFMVVEKPITVFRNELEAFEEIHGRSNNIFCLSYYLLEKALPLTFLYRPLAFYESYLDFNGERRETIMRAFNSLGTLKSIEVKIAEGDDPRPWAFDERYGGQTFETFIHPLILSRLVLGRTFPENSLPIIKRKSDKKVTSVSANGTIDGVDINLGITKGSEQTMRYAKLSFAQGGSIFMDLEEQRLVLESGNNQLTITVKQRFRTKYSIQLDMVLRCYREGINPSLIDGSDLQMDCLKFLML